MTRPQPKILQRGACTDKGYERWTHVRIEGFAPPDTQRLIEATGVAEHLLRSASTFAPTGDTWLRVDLLVTPEGFRRLHVAQSALNSRKAEASHRCAELEPEPEK